MVVGKIDVANKTLLDQSRREKTQLIKNERSSYKNFKKIIEETRNYEQFWVNNLDEINISRKAYTIEIYSRRNKKSE